MGNKLETEADRRFYDGRFNDALDLYQRILENIKDKNSFSKHARILNKIGDCYNELKEHRESIRCYEKALHIQQSHMGQEHISTATTYNCLGLAFYKNKQYDLALEYLTKSLEIQTKCLVENDKAMAANYFNIAQVLREIDNCREALIYYRKALEINTKYKGPSHPLIAVNHHGIGILYLQVKDFVNAEHHMNLSLDIRRRCFGKFHPEVAKSLMGLAIIATEKEEYDVALSFHKQALSIREKSFGLNHFDTIRSKQYIARIYFKQKRNAECRILVEEILRFYDRFHGFYNVEQHDMYQLLADILEESGHIDDCEYYREKAMAILGEEEPKNNVYSNHSVMRVSNPPTKQQISLRS